MNPRIPRFVLGSLLLFVLVVLAGAIYEWYASGVADLLLFLRIALVLVGLLVLYHVAAGRVPVHAGPDRCLRCSSRTFETRRAFDRKLVATCFVCGAESLVGPPVALDEQRRPPRAVDPSQGA